MDQYDIHVLVAGDPQVGKTCTCKRLAQVPKEEALNTTRTLMGEALVIKYDWPDSTYMVLKLTDIAGDQHARSLVRLYYRNLDGVLLVCDVTRPETLTSLKEEWLPEIEKYYFHSNQQPQYMLIVNKCDRPETEKKISENDIKLFCKENNIHCYVLSSAATWSWATNPTPIEVFFLDLVQKKRMKRPVEPVGPKRLRLYHGDKQSFKDKAVDEIQANCAFCG